MSEDFIKEAVRHYDSVGQELYELPWWAWIRRRRAMEWRHHYASRIADEVTEEFREIGHLRDELMHARFDFGEET